MRRPAIAALLLLATVTAHAAPRRQRTVTLDVKDEDIRVILKSMQKQCAVKNLLLDKDVQGTGTFLFREVPCRTAFDVVFRSAGVAGTVDGTVVSARKP
jgi:type II secretory pathway component GspD/PulD (secretin)